LVAAGEACSEVASGVMTEAHMVVVTEGDSAYSVVAWLVEAGTMLA